jgi:hypothetical protein
MMARLEQAGFVDGWYEQTLVAGQPVKERRYRLTKAGSRAAEETRAFYTERLAAARLLKRGAHA